MFRLQFTAGRFSPSNYSKKLPLTPNTVGETNGQQLPFLKVYGQTSNKTNKTIWKPGLGATI